MQAAISLYVAFNQYGTGHYDAVVLKNKTLNVQTTKSPSTPDKRCRCGRGSKHSSTLEHCGVLKYKYTTSMRRPCRLSGHGCIPLCKCSNHANPHGVKPTNEQGRGVNMHGMARPVKVACTQK